MNTLEEFGKTGERVGAALAPWFFMVVATLMIFLVAHVLYMMWRDK